MRTTKRLAPNGYVAIDKRLAEKLWNDGKEITIAGNNVNSFHIFGGWALGYSTEKARHEGEYGNKWESIINGFLFYLEPELGRYPVFYVRKNELTKV